VSGANAGNWSRGSHRTERSTGIIEVEQSVVRSRPLEGVFAFLADFENWSQWQPDLRESEQTSRGPMDVGTTFLQVLEVGGQRIKLFCEVTEYAKDEKLSFAYARDGLSFRLSFYFEPVKGGTRIISKGEGRMSGVSSLFEPLVDRKANDQIKTSLDDLKGLLESQTPDA
jgi:hypothetical protein